MFLRWLTPGLVLLTAAAVDSIDGDRAIPVASTAAANSASSAAPPATAAGLRVVMNPVTGEIVGQPTAEDLARLDLPDRKNRRRAGELESFDLPNGARGVALDGWAHHATRLERTPDGTFRVVCSQGDRHDDRHEGAH